MIHTVRTAGRHTHRSRFAAVVDAGRWRAIAPGGGAALALLALGLAGCGKKAPTAPNPATTGTMIVTVTGPSNAVASVTVSGPSDYAVSFGSTDTLIGLAAGTYTIDTASATSNDPIVTPFFATTITGSPAAVKIADTSRANVMLAPEAGSGRLWVTSTNGGHPLAAGYTSVEVTTAAQPGTSLSVVAAYMAFDAGGNLWVADSAGTTIAEYAAASLAASGSPSASVTLTSTALSGPGGLAFDRSGDLWIANATANSITEFTAAQLTAGGAATPTVVLTGAALAAPGRIAFDAYGNLWVPNAAGNTVVAFAPAQLAASGAPVPAITLSAVTGSLDAPAAVAFDQQGDLWVANRAGNTIVAFSNGQQLASGSPTPYETLTVPAATAAPSAFAFDNSGDLWAISAASSSLIEYSAQQIASFGATTPTSTIPLSSTAVGLAFDPAPTGLPLVRAARTRSRAKR